MKLVLDSGGVSHLAERNGRALELIHQLKQDGLWPGFKGHDLVLTGDAGDL